ncbi:MAG: CHAP domain-containing protein, partial [Candidatus Saccharibacteria bacterium]|nr:CHAP domain-containing protein [Candidatus Saccharibacteria bacterium]
SDALGLASAGEVATNFVTVSALHNVGQSSDGKVDLPTITDTTDIVVASGVLEHTVGAGETLDSIAATYGLTTDQIRWSNGLKTKTVSEGTLLYLPKYPGIVYTVKAGDTIESIVAKYGSSAEEIDIRNFLNGGGVTAGMKILIAGGSLPTTERPEYVAPVRTYTYSYLGSGAARQNVVELGYYRGLGGPYAAGWCTQWAWYKRQDLPSNLGNANTWATRARAAGYPVSRTPAAGAIFQTTAGRYGHVGYVESVNADGSVVVTEMNYGQRYRVTRGLIPANLAGNFYYIHRK